MIIYGTKITRALCAQYTKVQRYQYVDSKLLQAKGWSARSQGVVIFLSAITSNRSCKQGGGEAGERERNWQAAWSVQEVR